MNFEFASKHLMELYTENKGAGKYPAEVVELYRRRVRHIEAADNEQDLRHPTSVHFEKLRSKKYEGKSSMRLNQAWRLILSVEERKDGKYVLIHEITNHYGD